MEPPEHQVFSMIHSNMNALYNEFGICSEIQKDIQVTRARAITDCTPPPPQAIRTVRPNYKSKHTVPQRK